MKNFVVSQSCIKRFSEEEYLARTTMSDLIKAISHTALVVSATVLLCLFIPASTLLEFFFVLLGGLIIIGGGVLITREVTKLIDLRNRCSFQQELRELELDRLKRKQILVNKKYRRIIKGRVPLA